MKLEKEVYTDAKVVELSKRFINLQLQAGGPQAQKLNTSGGIPHIVFLNSSGEVLERIGGYTPAESYLRVMQGALTKADSALMAAVEKDLASDKPAVKAAALTKLGNAKSPAAAAILTEHVRKDDAPDAVRKAAIEALGKSGSGAEELVPLLVHKSAVIRTAATTALRGMGGAAVTPLLDAGVAADDPNLRGAAHPIAASLSKYPKSKTVAFWKTGPDEERKVALDDWKAWWGKNKPVAFPSTGGS